MKHIGKLSLVALTLLGGLSLVSCGGEESSSQAPQGGEITYEGTTLPEASVGVSYSADVGTATGASDITYALDIGQWLPEGLELAQDGTISGTPREAGDFDFTIAASATGSTTVYADFSLSVKAGEIETESIVLEDGTVGVTYGQALFTGENYNEALTYTLKEGSELPDGLKLVESGFLIGNPTESCENLPLTIIIGGEGFEATEVETTLTIADATLPEDTTLAMEDKTLEDAEVGSPYVATFQATGGSNLTYSRTNVSGRLPNGLTFDESGVLYGVPENATSGSIRFRVTASKEGMESASGTMTFTCKDKYVQTNRFEAEYVDLTGKSGAGYSSNPTGTGLIQRFDDASNGACVSYLFTEIYLDFVIESSKDLTGVSMTFCLASEIGASTVFDSSALKFFVNDSEIPYSPITVTGGDQVKGDFQTFEISDAIALNQGENTIRLQIVSNTLRNGNATGAPVVDYLELGNTDDSVGYRPRLSNLG